MALLYFGILFHCLTCCKMMAWNVDADADSAVQHDVGMFEKCSNTREVQVEEREVSHHSDNDLV